MKYLRQDREDHDSYDDHDEYGSSHCGCSLFASMERCELSRHSDESFTSDIFSESESYEESDGRWHHDHRDEARDDETREEEYEIGHA